MLRIKAALFGLLAFLLCSTSAFAANVYAVATGNWSSTAVWSTSSGGSPGATAPGSGDTAIFNSASGAITVTVTASTSIASLTANGFTGTLTNTSGHSLTITGSADFTGMTGTLSGVASWLCGNGATLGSGMTASAAIINMIGAGTLTSNSVTLNGLTVNAASATITLADALTFLSSGNGLAILAGTLDASTHNVNATIGGFSSANSSSAIFNMGSGTWTINGTSGVLWSAGAASVINAGTSTIKFNGALGGDRNNSFGGKTYYNIENATTGGHALTINDGGNTFHNLTVDAGAQLKVLAGSTQTVTALALNGTSGSPSILASKTGGSSFTISQASGTVTATYTTISDSVATGGATFNALTSAGNVNGGGNTGWNFGASSTVAPLLMPGAIFGALKPANDNREIAELKRELRTH